MAGWNDDIPWEDELPDDLPPEDRWEFNLAQLADGDVDEVEALPEQVRREPIAQQMLDRYRKLDAVLRNEAAKPIDGFDWDATADQIDAYVRNQTDAEERSLLLGGGDTTSRSFWANAWLRPLAGLAAAAAIALAVYGVWPGGSPAPDPINPAVAGNEDETTPDVSVQEPVLVVEVPNTPKPGDSVTTGNGTLEIELVQPPDVAGLQWDLPNVTAHERAHGSEVFIGPAEAPVEESPVDQ